MSTKHRFQRVHDSSLKRNGSYFNLFHNSTINGWFCSPGEGLSWSQAHDSTVFTFQWLMCKHFISGTNFCTSYNFSLWIKETTQIKQNRECIDLQNPHKRWKITPERSHMHLWQWPRVSFLLYLSILLVKLTLSHCIFIFIWKQISSFTAIIEIELMLFMNEVQMLLRDWPSLSQMTCEPNHWIQKWASRSYLASAGY